MWKKLSSSKTSTNRPGPLVAGAAERSEGLNRGVHKPLLPLSPKTHSLHTGHPGKAELSLQHLFLSYGGGGRLHFTFANYSASVKLSRGR